MIEIKPGQVWRKKNKRGPDTVRRVVEVTEHVGFATEVAYRVPDCYYERTSTLRSFRRWATKATLEVEA